MAASKQNREQWKALIGYGSNRSPRSKQPGIDQMRVVTTYRSIDRSIDDAKVLQLQQQLS
jgi:hypothetical protein